MNEFAYNELKCGGIKCLPVPLHSENTYTVDPVIFPGSFKPIHKGHLYMAQIASIKSGQGIWFEMSILNADKGWVEQPDLQQRVYDFWSHRTKSFVSGLVITASPNFVDKLKVMNLKQATFVVGADTFVRLTDPKYYRLNYQKAMKVLSKRAKFIVFPRPGTDIESSKAAALFEFTFLSECTKFENMSSTQIRKERAIDE